MHSIVERKSKDDPIFDERKVKNNAIDYREGYNVWGILEVRTQQPSVATDPTYGSLTNEVD